MLESLFSKVAGPEACFLWILQNFYGHVFHRTVPMAATDYLGLYNFVSNSNGTSLN